MKSGFIKVPRQFFETSYWNEKRKFSKTDALLDILQNVEYQNSILKTSYRVLAERWQWNFKTVQQYVKTIAEYGFVNVSSDTRGITFTNANGTPSGTPNGTPNGTPSGTVKPPKTKASPKVCATPNGTPSGTPNGTPNGTPRAYKNDILFNHSIEEDKEEKKPTTNVVGKEKPDVAVATTLSTGLSIEERQVRFYDTLRPYVSKYSAEMLRAFYDYWSEPNRSMTKIRMELEKTWSLSMRLATWHKRDEEHKFKNGKYNRPDSTAETVDAAAAAVAELIAANR